MTTGFPTQPISFTDVPIYNSLSPGEAPKVVPVMLNFATQASFTVDLLILQQRRYFKSIQSVFIDNSGNAETVSVEAVGQTQHTLVVPANAQAVLPIFSPNPPVFIVSTSGTGIVKVFFVNVKLPACVWNANSDLNLTGQVAAGGGGQNTNVTLKGGKYQLIARSPTWSTGTIVLGRYTDGTNVVNVFTPIAANGFQNVDLPPGNYVVVNSGSSGATIFWWLQRIPYEN